MIITNRENKWSLIQLFQPSRAFISLLNLIADFFYFYFFYKSPFSLNFLLRHQILCLHAPRQQFHRTVYYWCGLKKLLNHSRKRRLSVLWHSWGRYSAMITRERNFAAQQLQKLWKGAQERLKVQNFIQKRSNAATKIQSLYRWVCYLFLLPPNLIQTKTKWESVLKSFI